jgi:hypothetical protein
MHLLTKANLMKLLSVKSLWPDTPFSNSPLSVHSQTEQLFFSKFFQKPKLSSEWKKQKLRWLRPGSYGIDVVDTVLFINYFMVSEYFKLLQLLYVPYCREIQGSSAFPKSLL